jgi:D-sedoheptulose 7-phosphate isomerase
MSSKPQLAFDQQVRLRIEECIRVKQRMLNQPALLQRIMQVAEVIAESLQRGGKVLFFGNGGSAADAQHFAAELVGRYLHERRALPAIALTVNTSAMTAIANDYSYDEVFSRQIEAFGCAGDVAVGISTSGTSPNVVLGLKAAHRAGLVTVAFTGSSGRVLRDVAQYCVCVPSEETPRIQETHVLLGHIVCELVECRFLR